MTKVISAQSGVLLLQKPDVREGHSDEVTHAYTNYVLCCVLSVHICNVQVAFYIHLYAELKQIFTHQVPDI